MSATIGYIIGGVFLATALYGWVYERGYQDGRRHASAAARRAFYMREEER